MPLTALRSLFDAGVSVAALTDFALAGPLQGAEIAHVARAVEKRRLEFAAGRSCARQALARAGHRGVFALAAREDRRPTWPAGYVGTITHARGLAAAAVAKEEAVRGLGLDAELTGRVEPPLYKQIASEAEQAWIRAAASAAEEAFRATLLFSAKEAFYKAQYPLSESFLGFRDVRFHPAGADEFAIELLRTVPGFARGQHVSGRHARTDAHVVTGVTLPR